MQGFGMHTSPVEAGDRKYIKTHANIYIWKEK